MLHCHAATSHSFNDFTDNIVLPSFNHDVEIAVVSIISPASGTSTTTAGATTTQSLPIPWWSQIVLFLCCASSQHANGH
jgi:hypothetical protein